MAVLADYQALDRVRRGWAGLTLARQFAAAGSAVLLAGMVVIGVWVTRQIEEGVTRNAAAATALYVDSVIAPLLPNLRDGEALSEVERRALDETLARGELGRRLASFKIWKEGGLITYSSRPELIGRRFEPTENLRRAWAGHVAAEFDELSDDENALERAQGVPLLEIYSPIREPWSGDVVAVAEFYEIATELKSHLLAARAKSWLVVALVTLAMMGLLGGIVLKGSSVIASQRQDLEQRVAELSRLLKENEALRLRVQRASGRGAALNERFLKRVSADLHDGPAQLLALASLRLGGVARVGEGGEGSAPKPDEIGRIRIFLDEAMQEIRNICRGLNLPQIEGMGLAELLGSVVASHEQRTATKVALTLPDVSPPLVQAEKICVYRFVQEALSNAYRHAGGAGQSVEASLRGRALIVTVADQGSGFDGWGDGDGDGLGLAGMRDRVESLGGTFEVASSPSGTRLTMTLLLAGEESA